MRLALNYAGVENLQFEDDEYYYYVRAVPKMSVAAPKKRVKRFNTVDRDTDTDTGKTEPVEEDFDEDIIFPEAPAEKNCQSSKTNRKSFIKKPDNHTHIKEIGYLLPSVIR